MAKAGVNLEEPRNIPATEPTVNRSGGYLDYLDQIMEETPSFLDIGNILGGENRNIINNTSNSSTTSIPNLIRSSILILKFRQKPFN